MDDKIIELNIIRCSLYTLIENIGTIESIYYNKLFETAVIFDEFYQLLNLVYKYLENEWKFKLRPL